MLVINRINKIMLYCNVKNNYEEVYENYCLIKNKY